jgi:transposase
LKVLYFDGSGLWVCAKRLEKGRFDWPEATTEGTTEGAAARVSLSAAEMGALVEGLELSRTRSKLWWRKK